MQDQKLKHKLEGLGKVYANQLIMKDIRKDSISGIIEEEGLTNTSIHFSEWWNGEGIDFLINDTKHISLHMEEIKLIMIAAIASNMINTKECKEEARLLKLSGKERKQRIKALRKRYKENDL